jgi:two-component system cell cycle sensor histidine kinase/response regulator CckA
MKRPPPWRRQDEPGRQKALDRLDIVEGVPDDRLDAILEMARRFFGTESVSLNMLDQDLQVSIVCSGPSEREASRGVSFCDHLLGEEGLSIVPDATQHPVFHTYPNVVGAPFIRFYAGYPINSPDGYRVGMLCIFDSRPRELDELEQKALRNFALMTQDVLWSAAALRASGHTVGGGTVTLGSLSDIDPSSASRVEHALTGALDYMRTGVYLFDHDWRLFFVNQFGRSLFPDPSTVKVGDALWAIDPAAAGNEFGAAFRAAAEDGVVSTVRAYQPRLGGWYESTTYPIAEGVVIYFRDVTAEQSTREQLDDSIIDLQRKAALLDATKDAIVAVELDGTITYWNSGAESLYGWSAAESEGMAAIDLVTTEDEAAAATAWETTLDEGSWVGQLDQTRRDGTRIVADSRWQLEHDAAGRPAFLLCVASDATERRREEEARYRAQRMESLGTLAGGIAHDLNNVFTPILMSAQILATEESPAGRTELLDAIEMSVRRGADMIRQVLAFARGQDALTGTVDVRMVLGELLAFCHATLPKTIEMDLDVPDDLWAISGDGTQVLQILMNLVTNARDAMPAGGTLHVRARNLSPDPSSPGSLGEQDVVVVKVEDTGEGMDPAVLSKVFEPFFSTKAQGHGTGLGLSTSASIARSHGGDLRAYSERHRGSAFVLELPRAASTAAEPDRHERLAPVSSEGGVVLVVDDEALIRSIVEQTLERHGFETLRAENGEEAIEVMSRAGRRVDVVFTDMMMPVLGGAELIAWLGENRPDVALVVTSGLDANEPTAHRSPGGTPQFLAKPFTGADAVRAVHRALGRTTDQAADTM